MYAADLAHHACITFTVVQFTRAPDNLHLQIGDGCALEGHDEGSFAALPEETTPHIKNSNSTLYSDYH